MLTAQRIVDEGRSVNWERSEVPLLSSASEERSKYTAQASGVVRSLALAMIAISWLFGGGLGHAELSPEEVVENVLGSTSLRVASMAAVVCLLIDVIHYHWGALVWARYSRGLNEILVNDDFVSPDPDPAIRRAWKRAARWGLVDNVVYYAERTAGAPVPGKMKGDAFSTPISEARWYLAHAEQAKGMGRILGSRWSPTWINASIGVMFWGKALFVFTAYGAFLIYLVN